MNLYFPLFVLAVIEKVKICSGAPAHERIQRDAQFSISTDELTLPREFSSLVLARYTPKPEYTLPPIPKTSTPDPLKAEGQRIENALKILTNVFTSNNSSEEKIDQEIKRLAEEVRPQLTSTTSSTTENPKLEPNRTDSTYLFKEKVNILLSIYKPDNYTTNVESRFADLNEEEALQEALSLFDGKQKEKEKLLKAQEAEDPDKLEIYKIKKKIKEYNSNIYEHLSDVIQKLDKTPESPKSQEYRKKFIDLMNEYQDLKEADKTVANVTSEEPDKERADRVEKAIKTLANLVALNSTDEQIQETIDDLVEEAIPPESASVSMETSDDVIEFPEGIFVIPSEIPTFSSTEKVPSSTAEPNKNLTKIQDKFKKKLTEFVSQLRPKNASNITETPIDVDTSISSFSTSDTLEEAAKIINLRQKEVDKLRLAQIAPNRDDLEILKIKKRIKDFDEHLYDQLRQVAGSLEDIEGRKHFQSGRIEQMVAFIQLMKEFQHPPSADTTKEKKEEAKETKEGAKAQVSEKLYELGSIGIVGLIGFIYYDIKRRCGWEKVNRDADPISAAETIAKTRGEQKKISTTTDPKTMTVKLDEDDDN